MQAIEAADGDPEFVLNFSDNDCNPTPDIALCLGIVMFPIVSPSDAGAFVSCEHG
jgi:hypothetical protein